MSQLFIATLALSNQQRMRQMLKKCNHPTCKEKTTRETYACKPHWYALPQQIRMKINRTWFAGNMKDWFEADKEAQQFYIKEIQRANSTETKV
jgi:hypothetical protein